MGATGVCPVCHCPVYRIGGSEAGLINGHLDKARTPCKYGSYQSWDIAYTTTQEEETA